ncbi:MAG: polyprenyl synthetase family protein [Rubrivivax sp.]
MGHAETRAFDAAEHAQVDALLAEYGARLQQALSRRLAHSGERPYLDALMADYPRRGGKRLRPALCLAAAVATGATLDDALDAALAIELMHNALLVHDDIEDESDQRRGRPTLHALHGVPLALNAGDALGLLSLQPLKDAGARLGPVVGARLFEETERMAWATAEGQALELGWQRDGRTDIDEADYLQMVLLKTCWLTTIHPLRVGCLIGTRGRMDLDPLIRVGFFVGAAFQIQDDWLNLAEAPAYGKERDGDLVEGKRTLILAHALRHAGARDRARLQRFLAAPRERRRRADLPALRALLQRCGALDHARRVAAALAGAGLAEFDRCFAGVPDSRERRFLRAMGSWVLQRAH